MVQEIKYTEKSALTGIKPVKRRLDAAFLFLSAIGLSGSKSECCDFTQLALTELDSANNCNRSKPVLRTRFVILS